MICLRKARKVSVCLSDFIHRRSWHGPPPFSNFLFTNLFSIKFLYFFIISSIFPYFDLFVSIFIQSYVNIKLHMSTLLDTNNTLLVSNRVDKNCNIICLGDLNIHFMANIPTNIRDIIFINGFVNILIIAQVIILYLIQF